MPDDANREAKPPSPEKPSISITDKDLMDYAKEFWTVGNVVTGFSIVQALWFFTTVVPGHDGLSSAVKEHRPFAGGATLVVTLLYLLGICFAHRQHCNIINKYSSPEFFTAGLKLFWIIRYGIVIVTGGLVAFMCFYFDLMPVSSK